MESTTASGGSDKQQRNAGILGTFLDLQAKQRDANEPGEGKVEIDDDYIIASVSKNRGCVQCDTVQRSTGGFVTPFLPAKASDTVGDASMPVFQSYRNVRTFARGNRCRYLA